MGVNQQINHYIQKIKKFFKQSRLHKLNRRRLQVLDSISLTEKKWLRREIDKEAFRELNERFHKELITLEAAIEIEKIEERLNKFTEKEAEKLSKKRKPLLKKLLEEKEKILKELEKARKLYLKRKIDEQTYKSIVKEKQGLLIGIEASITSLYRDEVKEVMEQTEKKLTVTEEEALEARSEKIASDVAEQIEGETIEEQQSHVEPRRVRKRRRRKK